MMSSLPLLQCTDYYLLLLVVCGLLMLPSITSQTCHYVPEYSAPLVEISTSRSVHSLTLATSLNLTCTARLTDNFRWAIFRDSRPYNIRWFNSQGHVEHECQARSPPDAVMNCTLVLNGGREGNFTCQASNGFSSCTIKTIDIHIDIKEPEFVEVPLNHSAGIGSNVTFTCAVSGHPTPTITWTKNNNSDFLRSSPRAKIMTNTEKGQSHLVITGVTIEDYGKYRCVVRNSVGMKTSRAAVLYPGTLVPSNPRNLRSPTVLSSSRAHIIAIAVPCVVAILMICGISGLLWYRWSRRNSEIRDTEIRIVPITSTDSVERTPLEAEVTSSEATTMLLQETTENPYDIIDIPTPAMPIQTSDKVPYELLSGTNLMLGSTPHKTGELPPTPIQDVPPKRPPKPKKKENAEHQVVCQCCVLQSKSQTPRLEKSDSKDSGYDSAESRDSIFVDQETALDGERKSNNTSRNCLEEIEEGWEIDLERLEVLLEVLGEGEFGVVYKGRYRGQDGKIFDVAVKQLKDTTSLTNKADLLSEIKILKQAGQHPNIVNLVGTCTQKEKILVVTELIPGGTLESLLKSKRIEPTLGERNKYENVNSELNDRQLMIIAMQIASGMRHLEERKCIHRDLAARNVFIDQYSVAKVGDFGMARDISDDGIYTKTSSVGDGFYRRTYEPNRFCRIIDNGHHRGIRSQSGWWSFGIVLWEISTYGEEPYPNITTPGELITFLSHGYRMPRPVHCSKELYELMSSCWMENPLMRPTFADITIRLKHYLREFKRTYININDDGIGSDSEALCPH